MCVLLSPGTSEWCQPPTALTGVLPHVGEFGLPVEELVLE